MREIRYAQCWEDPEPLVKTLRVTPNDDVVSIASAGDNTFALLLEAPRSLVAVDSNYAQIFLTELKMRAIQEFEYEDFVGFVGARPCNCRPHLYTCLRAKLSQAARDFWDCHAEAIEYGVIHSGKFERYLLAFQKWVLPMIHQRNSVEQFLSVRSLELQKRFYERRWNNWRWRRFFTAFFSKPMLKYAGRTPGTFQHVIQKEIAQELLQRSHRGLTQVPIHDNYFVEYIFTGRYRNLDMTHPYLRRDNFYSLREKVGQIKLVACSLDDYLCTLPPALVSRFNLSDIFEYQSLAEFDRTLQEILRVSRTASHMVFWTVFMPRKIPDSIHQPIRNLPGAKATGRTFFYNTFESCEIKVSHGCVVRKPQGNHDQRSRSTLVLDQ